MSTPRTNPSLFFLMVVVFGMPGTLVIGCRTPDAERPRDHSESPAPVPDFSKTPDTSGSAVLVIPDEPDRWLFVEKSDSVTTGGSATGSFDRDRNKLTIETHDVQVFIVDTSRIPINWQRLVVLSIDGRNSELKKRVYSRLRFVRDPSGLWVVDDPKP